MKKCPNSKSSLQIKCQIELFVELFADAGGGRHVF